MAVTVTTTQPTLTTTAIPRFLTGSYGPSGATNKVLDLGTELATHSQRIKLTLLALSGTYVTGGFTLTPSTYGLKGIFGLLVVTSTGGTGTASGGAALPYLATTGNSPVVKLVTDNVPTELGNGTSVTNHSYNVVLFGTPGMA